MSAGLMTKGLLAAAMEYAGKGYRVFPQDRNKHPCIKEWPEAASTDPVQIRRWWETFPTANIAVATGRGSGLIVLDVDCKHGLPGLESLSRLELAIPAVAGTVSSITPSGGRHRFFRYPEDVASIPNRAALPGYPGIEVKGDGGCVTLPPSLYSDGRSYVVERRSPLLPLPSDLLALALEKPPLGDEMRPTLDFRVPKGERNTRLASEVGRLIRGGYAHDQVKVLAGAINSKFDPPLLEDEVERTITSIEKSEDRNHRGMTGRISASSGRVILRPLAEIEAKPLRWLWPGVLPHGKLSMLVGDPGLGKSLITLDIAARVSRGSAWPDGTANEPGDVVLLSAEDDPADTIRPRLEAAGADISRILLVEAVEVATAAENKATRKRLFSLSEDLGRLAEALKDGVRLIVVDPISAYLAGTDSHNNSEVRGLLAPLSDMAAQHDVTVLAVSHLNKGNGPAIYRTTGSLAFAAAARSVWACGRDPEDQSRVLVLPVKANLGPVDGGFAYKVMTQREGLPVIAWEAGRVSGSVDEILQPAQTEDREERAEAADWLKDLLSTGAIAAKEVKRLAAAERISSRALWKAKKALGVSAVKTDYCGGWEWRLTGEESKDTAETQEYQDSQPQNVIAFDTLPRMDEQPDAVPEKEGRLAL
jgi:putative DNA primase/helicase